MLRIQKIYCLGVLALALLMFLAVPVTAEEIRGTVINVYGDDNEFVMTDEELTDYPFRLAEYGKVLINGEEAQISDLQARDEVEIVYEVQDDLNMATSVRCTRAP